MFYRKITYRYSKIGFSRKYFKKGKTPSPCFRKTINSRNSLISYWNQFQVFEIVKFEFKVTVHYGLWAKCTQLWSLKFHKRVDYDMKRSINQVLFSFAIMSSNLIILCKCLRWKCCFCIEKLRSFRGLRSLDPHQRLCPWTPPGHLSGLQNPTPQGSRAMCAS